MVDQDNFKVTRPWNVGQIQHTKHALRCSISEAPMVHVWLV